MNDILNKNDIWIIEQNRKQQLLKKYRKETLNNVKLITIEELKRNYYLNYDNKAIYYLMKKYSYNLDVAKMYLSNITKVMIEESNNPKIKKVIELKKELLDNKLLTENKLLKEYLKGKKILLYQLDNLSKEEEKILEELKHYNEVTYYKENNNTYKHTSIITCQTDVDEINHIAIQITKLLENSINIKKIKLIASSEYEDAIKRIFKWYNIPVSLEGSTLYTTEIGQTFLKNLMSDKEATLKLLEEKYPLNINENKEIYNQIVMILNNYTWLNEKEYLYTFLEEEFKNTKINQNQNQNTITIITSLSEKEEDDYIFIAGFNQGEIPATYKDEDYFNNQEKTLLGLETSNEKNKRSHDIWLKNITETKNLTITMKKNSRNGECYISSLNDILNLELVAPTEEYTHSNIYNMLELSKKLDTLIKYNEKELNLELLFHHYKDINYRTFDNTYTKIDKERIKKYLKNNLVLSYSSMNTYYQCAFRYYLSNILKLNIYEETFYTIIGNLYHHILSLVFKKNINMHIEYQNYIQEQNYPFNAKELYFLEKLESELEFIIDTIKKQNENNTLTNIETEEKIEIPFEVEDMNIIFKGYVDKLMTNAEKTKIAIIDYKTGNPDLNLNNTIYGLDLQLPVYVYLALYHMKDARIVGFYLQKILNTEIKKDGKHTYQELKEEQLKLQGYSNQDLSLLKEFDANYENSNMIKGMRTTSKGLSTKKVFDDVKIDKLKELTEEKINEACQKIINGEFPINPKRIGMKNVGCTYCNFKSICFMKESDIVNLKEYKELEFLGGEEE